MEIVRRLQPLRNLPVLVQYGATALIAFAFFGAVYLLAGTRLDPHELPLFMLFLLAVILSAFLFARGSGYLAVLLCAGFSLYLLSDPRQPLAALGKSAAIAAAAFAVAGSIAAWLVELLRDQVSDLTDRGAALARSRGTLERQVAALEASDAQKELLLADINHRIKNQLQVVAGYIMLAQRDVGDARAAETLGTAANRLKVLARVYDRLQLGEETTTVGARGFIEEMVNDLQPSLIGTGAIAVRAEAEDAELSSGRAVTIGLMINELVTNAVRFAFAEDEPGNILVYFSRSEGGFCLEVIDDGRGFRSEARSGSVGQRMLRALVQQLDGDIAWAGPPGTRVSVTFPDESSA